jgi:hypothetical protein
VGLTIMLETGPVERFEKVANYNTVSSKWTSNGNKYLSWAFSEAAELARR